MGGENIKEYVISVISIAAIGAIISIITPDGEGGGLKKHVNLVVGLALIIICLSPITSMIKFISELDLSDYKLELEDKKEEYESIFQESYEAAEINNLKSGIKSLLYDEFGIEDEECRVSLSIDEYQGEKRLSRVFITLYGSAIWKDSNAIEERLSSLFGCEIVTAVG